MASEKRTSGNRVAVNVLAAAGAGALVLHGWRLWINLFGPLLPYRVDRDRLQPIDSEPFLEFVGAITDAAVRRDAEVALLENGANFYPAELEAVECATRSVNLEAYEFLEGEVTRKLLAALERRARAGVEVRLIVDAVGSWGTRRGYMRPLEEAGGRVVRHHPLDWKSWPYANHRSHRKLLVVDGRLGFIGGAGFADHWLLPNAQGRPWRDTVFRVSGEAVSGLNAVFAENWLEETGEVLAGEEHFPQIQPRDGSCAMVVTSTPGQGATRARILFQTLIEAARERIDITTPYFVPDRSARAVLLRALRERGVRVRILTAGNHSDHPATRRVGRIFALDLAKAGAEIYEYSPGMIHAKLMTVDDIWTVAGSTNFDHRSFALNDEVNIAFFNRAIAAQLAESFARDLRESRRLTPRVLENAPLWGRTTAWLSWVVRREQ
jgi:cardiolipin synthase